MALPPRMTYNGLSRKLVLAIDIGTTFSGVSYSILDPGQIPEIRGVNRYPGQESVGGDLKIPTILWYDQEGVVKAAGAEATREGIAIQVEEEQWVKCEWFKVYFRPGETVSPEDQKVPPLPSGKTLLDVFADFLRYIVECAKTYIIETHANGKTLWDSFTTDIDYVLTHPNGYEGPQQKIMRQAAILAGLVPDLDTAEIRVQLLTEGEASLHYCIQSGLTSDALKDDNGVMIVDAGGGTIDISSYTRNEDTFEEIAVPQCIYNGSVFVTNRARSYFQDLLAGSRFSDDVGVITEKFDKKTKLGFRNDEDDCWIQFAAVKEKDAELGIRSGQLKVSGQDVASFFEPSISDIVVAINDQIFSSQTTIAAVFLVGGFAASDWLFSQVKERLDIMGIEATRPDSHLNKAVAHGAVSYYLDHRVTTRVAKYTYGIPCGIPYDEENEEHIQRSSMKYQSASGAWYIPGGFDVILPRGTQVSESREFRRAFGRSRKDLNSLRTMSTSLMCYHGNIDTPKWVDTEPGMFTSMCSIKADLDDLAKTLKPRTVTNKDGREDVYYAINFDIALLFGLTEFKASVIWQENTVFYAISDVANLIFM
ncbi:Heat shock 70 kDa protein 12B [Psilocybe cubensis]|uniref:Heat shock 70 kDa protein 12B n=1 Tax=Psilocybe cubensis TaxID=181762 RepID=A0ACB8HDQ4_PSICU|nr:Heat shock 70 kDa protein 12B [Psilocybe cubensis]KAH9485819.1 Heat shock 70 kDa protein 12B [Psilocybe cubensis]